MLVFVSLLCAHISGGIAAPKRNLNKSCGMPGKKRDEESDGPNVVFSLPSDPTSSLISFSFLSFSLFLGRVR